MIDGGCIRQFVLGLAATVLLSGCGGTPVGHVQVVSSAADGKPSTAAPLLTGDFDSVLVRREGDAHIVTAYQQISADAARFGSYAGYRADRPFVTAELTMRFTAGGQPSGQPSLLLRQGDRLLTQGPLEGALKVEPDGEHLNIIGEHLRWRPVGGGADGDAVTFTIQVSNFKQAP